MPLVVQDQGILTAARQGMEVYLRFKGQMITLTPALAEPVPKPGGGHDYPTPSPRPAQLLALSKVGSDNVGQSPNDEGRSRTRQYLLTGRFDAEIAIGDTWEDDEATYLVDTCDDTNGYKVYAGVTGYIKV